MDYEAIRIKYRIEMNKAVLDHTPKTWATKTRINM